MTERQFVTGHNPDILTCLANLSADEVFTPPKLASAMLDLLPQELFQSPDTTFLDPFCKSGVFLREIARRLNEGLRDQMPDEQVRVDHILTKQVFGLATGELTAAISRRSVYCSKKADGKFSIATKFKTHEGNIRLPRTQHRWNQNARCEDCGASKEQYDRIAALEAYAYPFIHGIDPREIFGMKFDVIVGNPPYQLSDGGFGRSAAPVYHHFVEQAKKLDPRYLSMVIPARWFAGGKGLDDFREAMLGDSRLRILNDFLTASDVFPGVGLKGGICYFLWDRDNPGLCDVSTHFKDWPVSSATRPLQEDGADIFVRFNEGIEILRKVVQVEGGSSGSVELPSGQRLDQIVSPSRPFGLRTFYKGKANRGEDDLLLYRNGGRGAIAREELTMGHELVDCWKVYVGAAAPGTGNKDTYPHRIISTPFLGEPHSVCSETYICIAPLSSKSEAESVLTYLCCKLTRFLILLHKPTQHTSRKVYTFVPTQSWDRVWTDEALYAKYGLSPEQIEFIEKIVRPMDLSSSGADELIPEIDDED